MAESNARQPGVRSASPIDATLRGGMTPHEASGGIEFELAGDFEGRSWWRWIACALTPFGWVSFPTPQFRDTRRIARRRTARLQDLTLTPSCVSPDVGF